MVRRTSTAGEQGISFIISRAALQFRAFFPAFINFRLVPSRLHEASPINCRLADLFTCQLTKRQQCVDLALGEVMAGRQTDMSGVASGWRK